MAVARIAFALVLFTVAVIGYWALCPGLSGGFLFDDHVNLSALADYGGVRDIYTFLLYLTSGLGDPTGRPLSLLSFLVDARNWPASPESFLLTNILLHLVNGVLLARVLLPLGATRTQDKQHAELAAAFGAALWMLHPLFLSTTLYVVQREAMLPATFVLLGIQAWLNGRARLSAGHAKAGWTWLIFAAFICTLLATLCKANGALLPLLLLVTETTILSADPLQTNPTFRKARTILLGIPITVLIALFCVSLQQSIDTVAINRPWTIGQRLLTEPRALLDYLSLLVLPQPVTRGVFHDDFAASLDWLQPWTTLPAVLFVLGAIVLAWRFRKRFPVPAFAILFFFAGHLLESTVIPLELYFEHRNYLPAMMLFWPVSWWLTDRGWPLRAFRLASLAVFALMLAGVTHLGATLWGHPEALAFAWAARNPDSPRAQAYAAQYEIADGNHSAAAKRLSWSLATHPDESQLVFNLVDAECGLGSVTPDTIAAAKRAVAHDTKAAGLDFSWLSAAVGRAQAGECPGLDIATVTTLLHSARTNPRFIDAPGRIQDFDHVEGLIDLANSDAEGALAAFDRAVLALPNPAVALNQAALLGSANRPDLGIRHLDAYLSVHPVQPAAFSLTPARLHDWLLSRQNYWQQEFERMHETLVSADIPRNG